MPQYQQFKKGQVRIRILSQDTTRVYLFLMQRTGGKLQVLPNDVYVLDEALLPALAENQIEFENLDHR